MKDVREILTEKETELERLKKEVDSLRMVAPLLNEDGAEARVEADAHAPKVQAQAAAESHSTAEAAAQVEPGPKPPQSADPDKIFSSVEKADTGFWRLGKRRKHG
jgi:hypothetical protein